MKLEGHFRHTSGEHSHIGAQWQGSRGTACLEEFGILFLELQPHQLGELRRHVLVLLQRLCDLLLAHVLAQVSLYQVLRPPAVSLVAKDLYAPGRH